MDKRDYIALIKVVMDVLRLESAFSILHDDGSGVDGCPLSSCYDNLYRVWEVLERNSKDEFRRNDDMTWEEDEEVAHKFYAILENEELSPEEKYELLVCEG